jgi:MarR family transcriptional regulator, lower aerobic nicotinate degradation pathway regulator
MSVKTSISPTPEPSGFTEGFLENLGFVINKVGEKINREIELVILPHGLTVRQYGLMLLLQTAGPQSQIVLSERVGLDRTTVMRTVDLLEERGFVRRDSHPTDRRKHSVVLTLAGDELLGQTLPEVRQAEREFAAVLSEQEQAQLMLLLKRLLKPQAG